MDRRRGGSRGGGGARRSGHTSNKSSKRVGYLPRSRPSDQTQRRSTASNRRRHTGTARSGPSEPQSSWAREDHGAGSHRRPGARRQRSLYSHSSDEYLAFSSEDDGAHTYTERFTRTGRHRNGDQGRFNVPRTRSDAQLDVTTSGRRSGRGGDEARADSRRASRPRRRRRGRSRTDSRDGDAFGSHSLASGEILKSEDSHWSSANDSDVYARGEEENVRRRHRQGRRGSPGWRDRRCGNRREDRPTQPDASRRTQSTPSRPDQPHMQTQRREPRRNRSRSPPPPPRQWPHQPQARKYARQEAGPRAAGTQGRPGTDKPKRPPRRPSLSSRSILSSTLHSTPSSLISRSHSVARSGARRHGRHGARPPEGERGVEGTRTGDARPSTRAGQELGHTLRDAKTAEPPSMISPRHTHTVPCSSPGAVAAKHAPATEPSQEEAPLSLQPQPQTEEEQVRHQPGEHEAPYLTWLFTAKPASRLRRATTDSLLTAGGVAASHTPALFPSSPPHVDADGPARPGSATETAPPASTPWELVSVENRFFATSDRTALGLTNWRAVLHTLTHDRNARESRQGAEEDAEEEGSAAPTADGGLGSPGNNEGGGQNNIRRATSAIPRSRDPLFLAWAAAHASARTPQDQSLHSSIPNTPRGRTQTGGPAAPASVPVTPSRTPFMGPQGGYGGGVSTMHGDESGLHTPQLSNILTNSDGAVARGDAFALVEGATLEKGHVATEHFGLPTVSPYTSGYATPSHAPPPPSTGADVEAGRLADVRTPEVEWIPEAWRTDATLGVVYPSRLFLPRATFLDLADAENAMVFRWHFDHGFAHRRPPWFVCSDFEQNAEHPWACEWVNALPTNKTLADQLAESRAKVAEWRAQQHKSEEEKETHPRGVAYHRPVGDCVSGGGSVGPVPGFLPVVLSPPGSTPSASQSKPHTDV